MATTLPMKQYLSRTEAARALGLSAERVSQMARNGQLAYVETSLGRLYPPGEIERLLRERRAPESEAINAA